MMDFKFLVVEECEKIIPLNDKILAKSFEITHEVLTRNTTSLEEHAIIIKWVQIND